MYQILLYSYIIVGQLLKVSVMQNVVLPTATPVIMLLSIVLFLVTVTLVRIILKYVRQLTNASNVGLCAFAGLMQISTLR